MTSLVFFLEEPSAEAMLRGLLPRLLPPDTPCRFIVFEGKQDMEKRLVHKLRGYKAPDSAFVVMRDQDSADCHEIKKQLVELCVDGNKPDALVRILCRELESWYLADLSAVEKGMGIPGLSRLQQKARYRSPDQLGSPCKILQEITGGDYQKISGSRNIGPYLDLDNERSKSFRAFINGIRRLMDAPHARNI